MYAAGGYTFLLQERYSQNRLNNRWTIRLCDDDLLHGVRKLFNPDDASTYLFFWSTKKRKSKWLSDFLTQDVIRMNLLGGFILMEIVSHSFKLIPITSSILLSTSELLARFWQVCSILYGSAEFAPSTCDSPTKIFKCITKLDIFSSSKILKTYFLTFLVKPLGRQQGLESLLSLVDQLI
jgi:hypothetical protein